MLIQRTEKMSDLKKARFIQDPGVAPYLTTRFERKLRASLQDDLARGECLGLSIEQHIVKAKSQQKTLGITIFSGIKLFLRPEFRRVYLDESYVLHFLKDEINKKKMIGTTDIKKWRNASFPVVVDYIDEEKLFTETSSFRYLQISLD